MCPKFKFLLFSLLLFTLYCLPCFAQISYTQIQFDSLINDASYESREMSERKLKLVLPKKRTEMMLVVDKGTEISSEDFMKNYNLGLYDSSEILIIKDSSEISKITNNEVIKTVIKIE